MLKFSKWLQYNRTQLFLILLRNFTHRPTVIIHLLPQKNSYTSSVVLCGPFFRYIAHFLAGSFFCLTSLEWCQQFSFLDVHPSGKWQSAICSPNLEAKVISLTLMKLIGIVVSFLDIFL